jgi:glycosyltransferase involved in cell wall biosynthesis
MRGASLDEAALKIVHVCGWYFPDSLGGTEAYVEAVTDRLRAAGHEVLIAAPEPGAAAPRGYDHRHLPIFRYPIAAEPTRAEAQHVVPVRGAEYLHAWLWEIRADVVHFHTFVTGVGPHEIRAARATGARVIATTHAGSLGFLCQRGTMMRWGRTLCDGTVTPAKCAACELQHRGVPRPAADLIGLIPPGIGRAARVVPGRAGTLVGMSDLIARNQALQRRMLADVDAFVVLTDWAQDVTSSANPGTTIVVNRLGVRASAGDLRRWRALPPNPVSSPLRIAYLGRFEAIKGVHDLAQAIAALGRPAPIRFEFRGPVSHMGELEIVNELKAIVGPDAWVTFGDRIESAEIFEYLRGIDLLCCPSRTLEGGPTVALEAMAVGTPVIGTQLGALAEIIQDGVNGRLVPPADWRALAAALREIASNPAEIIPRWRAALPPMRSMDEVVDDYVRLYTARADRGSQDPAASSVRVNAGP